MTKRVISLKKVRKGGLAFAAPFESGEFWQAIGKAGPENSHTGILARREDGKRWGEIVARWDGKEARIGTFESVKVWGHEPVWIGRLELTGEWSRLPLDVRRGTADIGDSSEVYVRKYLVDKAVSYFTDCGKPRAMYTTTGRVRHADGVLEVVPIRGRSVDSNVPRHISGLDCISAFNRLTEGLPELSAGSGILHSAIGDQVILSDGAKVNRSYVGNYSRIGGDVTDSHVGDQVKLAKGSCIRGAYIDRGVHVGRGAKLIGGDNLNIDIRCPEVHVPGGVRVHERASDDGRNARYLVLGPIGGSPLTAIEDEGNPCAIWFAGEELHLNDLIQTLYRGYEEEPSRLDIALHRAGYLVRDQLRALLPLLVTTFPENLDPQDVDLALYGTRGAENDE